jgi:hypothetical protein
VAVEQRMPHNPDIALAFEHAVQVQQQRRLPGAVRADERHLFAGGNVKTDVVQGRLAVRVGEREVPHGNRGRRRR